MSAQVPATSLEPVDRGGPNNPPCPWTRLPRRLALAAVAAIAVGLAGSSNAFALTEASFVGAAEQKPTLSASGETLSWNAVDATRAYVIRRTYPDGTSEFAFAKRLQALPPAVPGQTLSYRVRPATASLWSNEVSITYPLISLERLTSLLEPLFGEKAEGSPRVAVSGETLSWNALDPTGAYLLMRTIPGGEPEYAFVRALRARPPAIPGATVSYRIKAVTGGTWSAVTPITYPEPEEEGSGGAGGPVVNALPTGPSAPGGGWHVVFADGFGLPLGSL